MPVDLNDVIKRVVAMQEQILGIRALDVLADRLDQTPYMTNGLGEIAFEDGPTDAAVYTVRMRLIVGHVTEGYKGQPERLLRQYIPPLHKFFKEHPGLTSAQFPTTPAYLGSVGAILTGGIGTAFFQEPGLPVQVGTELSLRVPTQTSVELQVEW